MALMTIASVKSSPGVTTFAMVAAALWPRPVLLADCDPIGGDAALRMPGHDGGRLDPQRGLVSLAAGGRRGLHPYQVFEHVQTLAGGLDILVGVSTPEQAQAMGTAWRDLGACLGAVRGVDVVADVGRLGPAGQQGASTLPLLLASKLVVIVSRPDLSSVVHLRERLGTLTQLLRPRAVDGVPICVAVVAPPDERQVVDGIREVLAREHPDVTVAGQLAYDPKGASFFTGAPSGRIDRSPLIRSGRVLTGRLADALAPFWLEGPPRRSAGLPAPARPAVARPPARPSIPPPARPSIPPPARPSIPPPPPQASAPTYPPPGTPGQVGYHPPGIMGYNGRSDQGSPEDGDGDVARNGAGAPGAIPRPLGTPAHEAMARE